MQNCSYACPCAATRLGGRLLVALSPRMVFLQHLITPLWVWHFAPRCLAPALLPEAESAVLCCHPSQGLGVHACLCMVASPGSCARTGCGLMERKGRGGAATTLGARHSKTGRSSSSLAKGSHSSLNLAYSNLPSGLPQESGGKETMWWVGKRAKKW